MMRAHATWTIDLPNYHLFGALLFSLLHFCCHHRLKQDRIGRCCCCCCFFQQRRSRLILHEKWRITLWRIMIVYLYENSMLNGRKQSRQHRNSKATSKQIAIVTTNVSRNNNQPKANQNERKSFAERVTHTRHLSLARIKTQQHNKKTKNQNKTNLCTHFSFAFAFSCSDAYMILSSFVLQLQACVSLSLSLALCVCVWHRNSEISIYIGLSHFNSVHSFVLYYK